MRSEQVLTFASAVDEPNYSDLQVLKSAAGSYIGTTYRADGYYEPGSRDSDYYETREAAEADLKRLETSQGAEGPRLRTTP